jgi:hypothetical protein
MIQRKQTLFLLQLAFLGISLLFIPVQFILSKAAPEHLSLVPMTNDLYHSTLGHYAAIVLNALAIGISIITVFIYKKRELQVKLCYLLVVIYLILLAMIAFCPFLENNTNAISITNNIFAYIICVISASTAYLAAFFVKKDIELLKSTDRIR